MAGVSHWRVAPAEAGQKLLQFLARRFHRDIPLSALQRWIRTGQVRVDGTRSKPGVRLGAGQEIRVPPHELPAKAPTDSEGDLAILEETGDLLILCKPAGLPVHPGSGHADSIAQRLKARYAADVWTPTPAHRLDRDTSGLLAAAKSYRALRELHDLWRAGRVHKAYLAWVRGRAPWETPTLITDKAAKRRRDGREKMVLGQGRELHSRVLTIMRAQDSSLVLVAPLTGRTHQIRVQLAGQGHPLLGDSKYGGPGARNRPEMLLHAWYLAWPGHAYIALPSWPRPWSVSGMEQEQHLLRMTRQLFSPGEGGGQAPGEASPEALLT